MAARIHGHALRGKASGLNSDMKNRRKEKQRMKEEDIFGKSEKASAEELEERHQEE